MSTVMQQRGTVAATIRQGVDVGTDPRRRRFGHNPGVLWMDVESRDSGLLNRLIPAGVLVPFETATLRSENFQINRNDWTPTRPEEYTAAWFINNVKTKYAEMGFMELESLTFLDDEPLRDGEGRIIAPSIPDAYFDAVYPTKPWISNVCPFDSERPDEQKGVCVTCALEYMDGGGEANPVLDAGILNQLRSELRLAAVTLKEHFITRWAEITGELDERRAGRDGLPALKKGEHHIRRHLHQVAPAELPALAAAAHGQATGELFMTGLKELADAMRESKPDDTVAQATLAAIQLLGEQQAQIARAQLQQGEVIARLLEQDSDKKTKEKVK